MMADAKSYKKSLPRVDEESRGFWEALARHQLYLQRCRDCGTLRYPPRALCPKELSDATEWVREFFGLEHAAIDDAIASGHGDGLVFLPYLSGERTPNRPHGTGVFAGLHAGHGRSAMVCAVVEGVTFGLAYALDALRRTGVAGAEITLVGGGSASDAWAQLCADVFEMPVVRPALVEAAASGAARQAQWAVEGRRPSAARVSSDRFEPRVRAELRETGERLAALRDLTASERP